VTKTALRLIYAVLGPTCLVAIGLLSGCVKTGGGMAVKANEPVPLTTTKTTLPDHISPNAFACFPEPTGIGRGTVAQVYDPAAPRLTVAVPDGWTAEPGQGDMALTLSGPDNMTGTVTIAETKLDPGAAFADYAAMLRRSKPDLQVETAGAKFCGYSSQKLTGTFLGPPGTLGFADRITHIWTNTNKYLVTVHLEGPADAPGFAEAKTALMQEFAVVIP
jgi:hypothetical protein